MFFTSGGQLCKNFSVWYKTISSNQRDVGVHLYISYSGDKIPHVEYTKEEIETWDAVYSKVNISSKLRFYVNLNWKVLPCCAVILYV